MLEFQFEKACNFEFVPILHLSLSYPYTTLCLAPSTHQVGGTALATTFRLHSTYRSSSSSCMAHSIAALHLAKLASTSSAQRWALMWRPKASSSRSPVTHPLSSAADKEETPSRVVRFKRRQCDPTCPPRFADPTTPPRIGGSFTPLSALISSSRSNASSTEQPCRATHAHKGES